MYIMYFGPPRHMMDIVGFVHCAVKVCSSVLEQCTPPICRVTEFNSGECRSGREEETCELVKLHRKVEGILINIRAAEWE
jgi:hypothetical protein